MGILLSSVAATTPSGLPAWGPGPAPGTDCFFIQLSKNRIRSHRGVLAVRTRLAFERQRFFEIKRDDCVARELQKEVAQRAHRDRMRGVALILFGKTGM